MIQSAAWIWRRKEMWFGISAFYQGNWEKDYGLQENL